MVHCIYILHLSYSLNETPAMRPNYHYEISDYVISDYEISGNLSKTQHPPTKLCESFYGADSRHFVPVGGILKFLI